MVLQKIKGTKMKKIKFDNKFSKSIKVKLLTSCMALVTSFTSIAQEPTEVTGLMNPVEVLYPETLIPTLKADTLIDAAFMNGYIHAKDRLFQMDYTRRLQMVPFLN